jgi:hypothetical protein
MRSTSESDCDSNPVMNLVAYPNPIAKPNPVLNPIAKPCSNPIANPNLKQP